MLPVAVFSRGRFLPSGSATKKAHWKFTKKFRYASTGACKGFASYLSRSPFLFGHNTRDAMQKRAALITSELILDSLSLAAIQPFSIKREPTRAPPVGHVTRLFVLRWRERPAAAARPRCPESSTQNARRRRAHCAEERMRGARARR
jgi:hypothetical protein